MTPDILQKLRAELEKGILTEVQVVYVLAAVRKLIERDEISAQYPDLKFHCDWVLHPALHGSGAKRILREFDSVHPLLRDGLKLSDVPPDLRDEIDRISKMRTLRAELQRFLEAYDLPAIDSSRGDGWARFLYLYSKVIEDIPLTVRVKNAAAKASPRHQAPSPKHISQITVHCESAPQMIEFGETKEVLFRVIWLVRDKNGEEGSIDVYNTFEADSDDERS